MESIEIDENDPFASFNESIFEETTLDRTLSHFELCSKVFRTVIVLVVTVLDILLIYVIMKHKRLRTRSNFYILHYSLVNLIYLLFTPVFYIVYGLLLFDEDIYCLIFIFHNSALFMQIFFSIGLLLDWLLMSFNPHVLAKYHIFQKYFFIFVYALGLLKSLVYGISCFHPSMIFQYNDIINRVAYSSSVLSLAIIYILKYRRNQPTKTVYFLTVASWMILSWLPDYFFHFIIMSFDVHTHIIWFRILITFFYLSGLLSATAPIWITIHLAKSNKYFKMAFDRIFKKKVNNYQSDNLDEASDEEEIVNSNTVQVGDIVVNYHKEISGSGAI